MWRQLDLLLDRGIQEAEREFYGLIGLVAVRFARLEAQMTDLLSTLIHPNDGLMAATLTENIAFAKAIELIKKIGHMRPIEGQLLREIISEANFLRRERNDYVHGIWRIKIQDSGVVVGACSRRKMNFRESDSRKLWTLGYTTKTISLDRLVDTALRLENLSSKVQDLIDEIEEHPLGFVDELSTTGETRK